MGRRNLDDYTNVVNPRIKARRIKLMKEFKKTQEELKWEL